jgi:beta-glucosidase
MKLTLNIILLIMLYANGQNQTSQFPKYLDATFDFETRAIDLVNQMTLDEKISQLGDNAPSIARLGVPEYNWWNEALHGVARAGVATVFPQAIGMAASFDTEIMYKVANVISDEARAKYHEAIRNGSHDRYYGLTFWSPNINIFSWTNGYSICKRITG